MSCLMLLLRFQDWYGSRSILDSCLWEEIVFLGRGEGAFRDCCLSSGLELIPLIVIHSRNQSGEIRLLENDC